MVTPGLRIVRGPDWSWGDQDGGEGFTGTVCEIGRSGTAGSPDKTVVVQWDNGTRTNYRVGYVSKFDLTVFDNAQIGVKHPNIVCDGCKSQGIYGMRYKCTSCYDYDLCYACYHNDKHDLRHAFKLYEYATSIGVELPIRENARKCVLMGIFAGATVVRGLDWEWGNQDGGEGKTGCVTEIRGWDNESGRSVANVVWSSGTTNVYRLGQKGNCDIKFVQPSSGGSYYPDHLPVLGKSREKMVIVAAPPRFRVGDKVRVATHLQTAEIKAMQQGHGGWNVRMMDYVTKIGAVHRVTDKGDIRVQYDGCNNRWTFNPAALVKVEVFQAGDVVSVIEDAEKVKKLQKGHGEWIDVMKNTLGKVGRVLKVYSDGDLRVQLDGHAWTLNPRCVRVVPGSAAELANTMHASQNQRLEPSIHWPLTDVAHSIPSSHNLAADRLVRAAAQGNADACAHLLKSDFAVLSVDTPSGGKTALQVASHQGHLSVVRLLLDAGASPNATDNDGDTCLHYAAFGNRPDVLHLLLHSGSSNNQKNASSTPRQPVDINASNRSGCTALHVAAHKRPAHCARVLLDAGADPNRRDLYGDTPLHDAIGKDNLEVVELFLHDDSFNRVCSRDAFDVTLRNRRGFNALHHAALKGKTRATILLLRRARQLVDVKKDDGFAAIHLAALNGHVDVLRAIVRQGRGDVNLRNNRRQTALQLAVGQAHCGCVESLVVDLGADLTAKDEDGETPLHGAVGRRARLAIAASNAEELAKQIVEKGDCPQIRAIWEELTERALIKEEGRRLMLAVACFLVRQGSDLEMKNDKGETALTMAEDDRIRELLLAYGVGNRDGIKLAEVMNNENDGQEERIIENISLLSVNGDGDDDEDEDDVDEEKKQMKCLNVVLRPGDNTTDAPKCDANTKRGRSSAKRPNCEGGSVCAKPVECLICSELSEDNVLLEPCRHKPACEDCSSRMKKCLQCGLAVSKRVTKDGRIVPPKSRQPSAERMRYLESKIAEIEESHACGICMERKRNVVFLCGHGACAKCADTLNTCHMCRKTIAKKIPVY